MRRQFYYEFQARPTSWFGKLFVGLAVVLLLWLAIAFFSVFLVVAGILVASAILYAALPFPKRRRTIKGRAGKDAQATLHDQRNREVEKRELK